MEPRKPLKLALIALACAILAGGLARAQEGSWADVDDMPTPRRLLAAASENGNLYTFGGCGSPCFGPPFHTSADEETTVEAYLPQQKRWVGRGRMPTILFSAAAAAPGNGKIYTFGGYVSGNVVQEYDPATDTWKIKRPMPTPRYGLAAVALEGRIYVLGGSGPGAALEIYDPKEDSWTSGPPMPTPRVFLAAAVLDRRIYALGGSPDCCGNSQTDAVEIYDPDTKRWETGPRLPSARQVSAAAGVNGSIYVFGGFIPGSGVQADTLVYDPQTGWTFGTPMPVGRDQAPAALIGSDAYVPGGSVDCHCRALGNTESFGPEDPVLACAIDGPSTVAAGALATFSITVFNRGEATAAGVELGDFTPAGLSLASADEPCERGLPCLLGTIDPGDSRTTTVTFQVPPGCSAPKSFRPEAKVTSGTQESTCRPDRPTRTERPPVDLVCEKRGPLSARPGERLAYQVAIRNLGCEPALNVDVADPAPAGLVPDCGKPSCSTRIAKIPPRGSARVPFAFQVPLDYQSAGILNQAQVSQAQPQEMPAARANNTCEATTPVRCLDPFQNPGDPPADLPLGIWGIVEGPAQAVEGSFVEYLILLANGGPAPQPDSDEQELEHLIPIGLELESYEADSGQLQLHEPTVSGDFTTALLWDGAIPLCGTVAIRVKALVVGEAGSKICLQGTIGADRLTGLRGAIDKGEPFCLQVVMEPPA